MKNRETLWNRALTAEEKVEDLKRYIQNPVDYRDYEIHNFDHEVQGIIIHLQLWRDEVMQHMKENKVDNSDD